MFDHNFFSSHIFDILTEFDEKVVEELPVEVLAHLVEDEPVPDGAVGDVAADQIQVLTSLEVPNYKHINTAHRAATEHTVIEQSSKGHGFDSRQVLGFLISYYPSVVCR